MQFLRRRLASELDRAWLELFDEFKLEWLLLSDDDRGKLMSWLSSGWQILGRLSTDLNGRCFFTSLRVDTRLL